MVMEFLIGLMAEDIEVNMPMIKRRDMEPLTGRMANNIQDNGRMDNNMELEI